ncbi:MAG TPA: SPOR domain-containing protein, partial [Bryobacteraceae bacterium]|nr:SPOR domain-containing protein [Bryobacteraceae bacterium]
SVFFIIAILLGVFFTMGYIMGRNSAPVAAIAPRETITATAPRQDAPSAMPQGTAPAPAAETPSSPAAEPGAKAGSAPQAFGTESAKPRPAETPEANAGTKVTQPQPGQMYVQVSSMLAQSEAEILVDVLGKKGFRAIIAPGPNEGRFRVLVGPVSDAADAGRVKTDLEQAGFKGAFPKKY